MVACALESGNGGGYTDAVSGPLISIMKFTFGTVRITVAFF